ncbi:MAG: formylglycine-generating enzyme family protein [Gammaproteobacteria bacterium]|nr:formylglycine-generating enzyme family protein [Gammaproteobacteria bacterium]
MVVILAGSYLMGSLEDEEERWDDEGPQHEMTIAKPFALGRYAVTFAEYDRFCESMGREKPEDEGWGRWPVINVRWEDAKAYAKWLTEQTGSQ